MIDHDKNIGQVLDYLDELGIADDTFVMYSTDNGPHMNSWPDGGMTPFRSEKNTNWEGAFRVPHGRALAGQDQAGSDLERIVQHHDWFPTFLAMAGDPDVVEKLKSGYQAIGRTYKNHIDGYNLVPYLTGEAKESPRKLLHVFERRRRRAGLALRQLEDARSWSSAATARCRSGRSRSRGSEYRRSSIFAPTLTSGRIRLQHLLGVVHSPHLLVVRSAGGRRPMGGDLQGLPAGSEAQHLHPRRRVEDDARNRLRNALSPHSASGGRLLACRLWRSTLSGQGRALRPEIRGGPR